MPNIYRRRDSTVELSRVVGGFGRRIENWTCWEFIQSSLLQNWKLGHDCRRVSTHRPTQLNSTQHVQFSFSSTRSVGSRREQQSVAISLSDIISHRVFCLVCRAPETSRRSCRVCQCSEHSESTSPGVKSRKCRLDGRRWCIRYVHS